MCTNFSECKRDTSRSSCVIHGTSERDTFRGSCEIDGGIRKLVKSERVKKT